MYVDVQVQEEVETCRMVKPLRKFLFRTRTPEQGDKLLQILENVERGVLGL